MAAILNITNKDLEIISIVKKFYAEIDEINKSGLVQNKLSTELGLSTRLIIDLLKVK